MKKSLVPNAGPRAARRPLTRLALLLVVSASVALPLFRAQTAGELDEGFGGTGKVLTDFGGSEGAADVIVQPDGKLVVVGYIGAVNSPSPHTFGLARYNPDGSLDATFGQGGKVTTNFPDLTEECNAIALLPDGRILTAGSASTAEARSDFLLVRYNSDGSLDTSFGQGGKAMLDFSGNGDGALSIAVQPDGKYVAAGATSPAAEDPDFALARFNADGTPDASFGNGGSVVVAFGNTVDFANAVRLQPDGRVVAAGGAFNLSSIAAPGAFALVRLNPNGTPDPTFGQGGKVTTPFTESGNDSAAEVLLQPDGKLVAAGGTFQGLVTDFALARYNPDGTLDASFGQGGKVTTDFDGGGDQAQGAALLPDGRIVAGGISFGPGLGSFSRFGVARYNADGSSDNTFGRAGRAVADFGGQVNLARALAAEPGGKVVVVGEVAGTNSTDFGLARFHAASPGTVVSSVRFSAAEYVVDEDCAAAVITVTRSGDLSAPASVEFNTTDGTARQRTDFTGATGRLDFAPGEAAKTFQVLVGEDAHVEGDETLTLALTAASAGVAYDAPHRALLRIRDDDAAPSAANPIDDAATFVCQHYHDFLNRQSDEAGQLFWTDQITSCGADPGCVEVKRINVSAAFFLSIEFQQTGYFVMRVHKAGYSDLPYVPRYDAFMRDTQRVGLGVVVGQNGWEQRLRQNKLDFALEFVRRPRSSTWTHSSPTRG